MTDWASEADEFVRGFIERQAGRDAQQAAPVAPEQPPLDPWWCQHPRLSPGKGVREYAREAGVAPSGITYQRQAAEVFTQVNSAGDLSEPRLRLTKNGPRHRRQCQDCGAAVGNAVSKIDAEKETGSRPALPFDEAFYERGRWREADRQEARLLAHQAKRTAWWEWYDRYLQSPEWRDKRNRVLRRAKGVCEGCLLFQAAHIHHTTYAHVGNELLFELVALCEGCHDLVHEDNPNAPLAWMRDGPP